MRKAEEEEKWREKANNREHWKKYKSSRTAEWQLVLARLSVCLYVCVRTLSAVMHISQLNPSSKIW